MDESSVAPLLAALHFLVDVDGRPVGTHDFHVERTAGGAVEVRSNATFTARILGVPVYRYRHSAQEHWARGCLQGLEATTDDNGRRTAVRALSRDGVLQLRQEAGDVALPGCIASFAYWDPRLLAAPRLLNPQTGQMAAAVLEEMGPDVVTRLDGRTVDARHLRLHADRLVIDLWYDAAGGWLQLASTTAEGRHLRYRRDETGQ